MKTFCALLALVIFSPKLWAVARNTRNEMFRYTLLRDRTLAERAVKGIHKQNYFSMDLHISDGLKSFLGDLKGAYGDTTVDSTTRANNVDEILSQHLNTEYYLDADAYVGIPLPQVKIKKITLYPALFGGYNGGGSMSVSNMTGASQLQIYAKVESKAGLNVLAKLKDPYFMELSFYHMNRKDDYLAKNGTQISSEQKVIAFNGLRNEQNSQRLDATLGIEKKQGIITLAAEEIVVKRSDVKPEYGNDAFLKLQYQGRIKKDALLIEPFAGLHRRARYAVHKGLYAAVKIEKADLPFKAMMMLDPGMLTTVLRFEYKLFRAAYTLKLPHQNPVDHVWVPKMNSLMLNFSF